MVLNKYVLPVVMFLFGLWCGVLSRPSKSNNTVLVQATADNDKAHTQATTNSRSGTEPYTNAIIHTNHDDSDNKLHTSFNNAYSNPPLNGENLLVVVIAGGSRGLVYPSYRAIWNAVADRVATQGVYIYLLSMDPGISSTIVKGHHIIIPGIDSLIPGVLNETLLGLDYVFNNRLPGSKAPFVLRTNLSSFWQFNKLLAWLKGKVAPLLAAFPGRENGLSFPSGAGTLMSVDLCKFMLSLDRSEVLGKGKIDDLTFGEIFREQSLVPMKRTDLLSSPYNIKGKLSERDDIYHYRIKGGDELRDVGAMTWLFNEWYNIDKLIREPQDAEPTLS